MWTSGYAWKSALESLPWAKSKGRVSDAHSAGFSP
jgi:hypothetical protein